MTERQPARDSYDALVELFPPRGVAKVAYALVRRTYHVADNGRMSRLAPLPLTPRVEGAGPLCARWGDLSFARQRTDVAVRGAAYAAGSRLTTRRQIALSVGERQKRVEVFGRRTVEWSRAEPRFSDPEPFSFVQATLENAYGGLDPRVTLGEDDARGRYPRNPVGKGYLVGPAPAESIELPNLEDPDHLLTPASILADPDAWWRQPLPFCFEPSSALAFPRSALGGAPLLTPPPEHEELEEVRRGFLPRGWRALAADLAHDVPPAAFAQRGALGQSFDPLAPDTRIAVYGMHPTRERFELAVPLPPRIVIAIDGKPVEVAPRLVSVLVEPREERVSFTWAGVLEKLPRLLMPTLHASIPLAMRADDDAPIEYLAPPTLRELIEAIIAKVRTTRPRREPERDTIAPPPPPPPAPEEERGTDPGPIDPPGAPPRVGRIADVEAFVAPYQAPAGATFRPPVEAVWRSDGEHTGRLALPGEERPAIVPKTLQIALPEAARAYSIPETRQVVLPEARSRDLKPERTAILSDLSSKLTPLAEEQTKILSPAPSVIAAPSLPQLRPPARERTQILTEGQLRGEEPVPGRPGTASGAARRVSMYEESTSVLSSAELDADELTEASHLDDLALDELPLGAPRSEAVFLDEPDDLVGGGTQVLYDAELTELDEDE